MSMDGGVHVESLDGDAEEDSPIEEEGGKSGWKGFRSWERWWWALGWEVGLCSIVGRIVLGRLVGRGWGRGCV